MKGKNTGEVRARRARNGELEVLCSHKGYAPSLMILTLSSAPMATWRRSFRYLGQLGTA